MDTLRISQRRRPAFAALLVICLVLTPHPATATHSVAPHLWQSISAAFTVQAADPKAKSSDAKPSAPTPPKAPDAGASPPKAPPAKNPKKKKAPENSSAKSPPKAEPTSKSSEAKEAADESEFAAMNNIAAAIRESLEVGPTLVVWLIDRTPSAYRLAREVTTRAQLLYESEEIQELVKEESQPLLTAIAAFDEKVEYLLDPPASDPEKTRSALGALKQSKSGRELTFAALKQVLNKYSALRTAQRREILVVVVTDEAGDDPAVADELVTLVRQRAIPVYVIGVAAPWGQVNPFAPNPKAIDANRKDDAIPTVGPESFRSERVEIQAPQDKSIETDLVDSGFGPFALEKLCRASHGQFFAVRNSEGLANNPKVWPTGKELRFEEGIAAKYAPQYLSEADYQKFISENKARSALAEAAKLNKLVLEGAPVTRFPKDVEAKMAKQSNQAQQYAARNTPEVDQFFDILSKGEGDRDKLTSPRWQAEYDLALGRVMAIKVRLDGYNSMIAALKRGKTFANASSKTWVLTPADAFETESTLKKMGERAKMYLERVVKDHPGTPWAKIAAQELKTPLGWTWKES